MSSLMQIPVMSNGKATVPIGTPPQNFMDGPTDKPALDQDMVLKLLMILLAQRSGLQI